MKLESWAVQKKIAASLGAAEGDVHILREDSLPREGSAALGCADSQSGELLDPAGDFLLLGVGKLRKHGK